MQSTERMSRYIGTSGAAKHLGRSIKTIHRYVKSGRLTPIGRLENGGANDPLIFHFDDVETLAQQLGAQE